jgi:hypothetical protein
VLWISLSIVNPETRIEEHRLKTGVTRGVTRKNNLYLPDFMDKSNYMKKQSEI